MISEILPLADTSLKQGINPLLLRIWKPKQKLACCPSSETAKAIWTVGVANGFLLRLSYCNARFASGLMPWMDSAHSLSTN